MRTRNGMMHRKPDDDPDPYWRGALDGSWGSLKEMLVGDWNRMERDYLGTWPETSTHPHSDVRAGTGRCLSDEVAQETGVDVETVKKVLRYVFLEQP